MGGPVLMLVGAAIMIIGLYAFVKRVTQQPPPEPDDEPDRW